MTSSAYDTTTAETVTTTQVSITESTQETTQVTTVTSFETSFVTETTTVATVTQVANKQRKKRGKCVHNASPTSSSSSSAAAAAVCTTTVTASAPVATTTTTITGSATATATQTVTSLIVATTTVTVSTTEVKTTAVPTTVSATATTVLMPQATPTLVVKAVGGRVDGQYVTLELYGNYYYQLKFTPDVSAAAQLYVDGNGRLLSPAHEADTYAYIDLRTNYNSPWFLFPAAYGGSASGGHPATCQVNGPTTTGSTGSLTCPNGSPDQGQFSDDGINLTTTNGARGEVITLQYVVV